MINPKDLLSRLRRNPLLAQLNVFRSTTELAAAMHREPFDAQAMQTIPPHMRLMLAAPDVAVVSKELVKIHFAQQVMLCQGYAQRDPNRPEMVAALRELAERVRRGEGITSLPWQTFQAGGCIVEGVTGVGKSFGVDSFFSQLRQVITHRNVGDCAILQQLVYLRVHMSADGSRHGFILNAMRAMDEVLGTDYAARYSSHSWSVERLLVVLLYLFSLHRLGVLIIEEAQERNMAKAHGREFLTFFLRLLNHGIPVTLVGNPLAFRLIESFSQDAARFSVYGRFRLDPIDSADSRAWKTDWVHGLWTPRLTTQPDEYFQLGKDLSLELFLWQLTGGFPRHLARLRREAERIALLLGREAVTKQDVVAAYTGPEMSGVVRLSEAFVMKDANALKVFDDVDAGYYAARWTAATQKPSPQDKPDAAPAPDAKPKGRKTKATPSEVTTEEALAAMRAALEKQGGQ